MNGQRAGFSLVEVAIAVGIFAVAMTGVLALLPALAGQSAETADQMVALRLTGSAKIELERLAAADFAALAAAVPVMTAPLHDGLALVAVRDGVRLHSIAYLPPPAAERIPAGDRYFLVEAWRFDHPPLAYDAASPWLALAVRVSWPYAIRGGAAVAPPEARRHVMFTIALNR